MGGLSGNSGIALSDGSPLTLSVGGNGASTTYGGILSGSGGLIKTGSGILTFASLNNYSGSTTLTQGELSISASSNLSPNSPLTFNGGILQITGAVTSLANTAANWSTFNGGFDIANPSTVFTVASLRRPGQPEQARPRHAGPDRFEQYDCQHDDRSGHVASRQRRQRLIGLGKR